MLTNSLVMSSAGTSSWPLGLLRTGDTLGSYTKVASLPLVLVSVSITRNCAAALTRIGSSNATDIPPAALDAEASNANKATAGLP